MVNNGNTVEDTFQGFTEMLSEEAEASRESRIPLLRYAEHLVTRGFQHGHCSPNRNARRPKAYRQEEDQDTEVKANRKIIERASSALVALPWIL